MAQKNKHYIQAKKDMQNLGIYKPEFEPTIEMYAQLKMQYSAIETQFRKSKYKFEVDTATGVKKAPIVTTLETLRKDILTYANALGLTPQGLLKADEKAFEKKKPDSALAQALKELGPSG